MIAQLTEIENMLANTEKVYGIWDTRRFAIKAWTKGLIMEFGTASGKTSNFFASHLPKETIHTFDWFQGLPEDWREGFKAGKFAQDVPTVLPNVEIHIGLFQDSLPEFLKYNSEEIGFLHLDADLYSSTKFVLDCVKDRISSGTIILFDEYYNYEGYEDHELKAWLEFTQENNMSWQYLAYNPIHEQVVVKIL